MSNETIISFTISVAGIAIPAIVTLIVEYKRRKREKKKERQEIFHNRPEMKIVEHKDYTGREGYGIKQKCDIELFVAKIENVATTGKSDWDVVDAHYRDEDFNQNEWCCVIYTLKNAGKTDISTLSVVCNFQKDTCIFKKDCAKELAAKRFLNYTVCYDKKIRTGETITLKLCYHKDRKCANTASAIVSFWLEDDNGRYWVQPLFAPRDKIYDSRLSSYENYMDEAYTDLAEKCIKRPWLW